MYQPHRKLMKNDMSSYDASICRALGKLEVSLARKFGVRGAALELMEANIDTRGMTSHGIKYKCKGTRKSGDPYTTLFNSILNGLLHLYCISNGGQVPLPMVLPRFRMLVVGDDNLTSHDYCVEPDWWLMRLLGFDTKDKYCDTYSDAEFCSNVPVETQSGWVFTPKLGRVLNKFGVFLNPPVRIRWQCLLRGVVLGLQQPMGHLEPMQILIQRVLQITASYDAFTVKDGDWKMSYRSRSPIVHGSLHLINRYHFCHSMLLVYKKYILSLGLSSRLTSELFQILYDRETAGPQEFYTLI
jgi:hypothetical protein